MKWTARHAEIPLVAIVGGRVMPVASASKMSRLGDFSIWHREEGGEGAQDAKL